MRFRFAATATGLTDSERLLIDSIKRRSPKLKKSHAHLEVEGLSERPVVALSTAEEYNLETIGNAIAKQGLYHPVPNDGNDFNDEDILHLTAKYKTDDKKREFFIFREGSIVFWNMTSTEASVIGFRVKKLIDSCYL